MYSQFQKRLEEDLALIRKGIETKGGIKRWVHYSLTIVMLNFSINFAL
jgi:hypothetical protein